MQDITNQPISSDMVRDLIDHFPNPAVEPQLRYLALTQNFSASTPGYTVLGDITAAVQPGATFSTSGTDTITSSCSVALSQHRLDELGITFNPTRHMLQVWVDYIGPRGSVLASWPFGMYRFKPDLSRDLPMTGPIWHLAGLGIESFVEDVRFESTYVPTTGTDFGAAIQRILTNPRVGGTTPSGLECAGSGWPSNLVSVPVAGITTPAAISYDWSKDQLEASNALAKTGLLWNVWGTALGVLKTAQSPLYRNGIPTPSYNLRTDARSIIVAPVTQELQGDWANRVRVDAPRTSGTPLVAFARNRSLDSLISFDNYGSWVDAQPISDSNIPDQVTCQAVADLELQAHSEVQETITVTTPWIPFLELHDFIGVYVTNADGSQSYIDSSGYPFAITGSQVNADGMTTTWTLAQTVPI